MKTLSGDRILIEEGPVMGQWTVGCEGCQQILIQGHHSKTHAHDVAREHAKKCTGEQGDLLELLDFA